MCWRSGACTEPRFNSLANTTRIVSGFEKESGGPNKLALTGDLPESTKIVSGVDEGFGTSGRAVSRNDGLRVLAFDVARGRDPLRRRAGDPLNALLTLSNETTDKW